MKKSMFFLAFALVIVMFAFVGCIETEVIGNEDGDIDNDIDVENDTDAESMETDLDVEQVDGDIVDGDLSEDELIEDEITVDGDDEDETLDRELVEEEQTEGDGIIDGDEDAEDEISDCDLAENDESIDGDDGEVDEENCEDEEQGNVTCTVNLDCPKSYYCEKDGCVNENGTCVAKPSSCPDILSPVCGCDGKTYDNSCYAASAGINVDYNGACSTSVSCHVNGDCSKSEFCYLESCAQETGQCNTRPLSCPDTLSPVCGCDGKTYDNSCYAASAGINVDYSGACSTSVSCYGNGDCAKSEYCYLESCDQETGTCKAIPSLCPLAYSPVCGCDGKTYDNACYAAFDGVNVDYDGFCTTSVSCHGNGDCSKSEYCYLVTCAQETGKCNQKSTSCPDILSPVCGCDGKTYDNACYASSAGVNVDYDGACKS